MSSKKSSGSKSKRDPDVILDSNGNINASKLEENMKHALEYDVKYKQTDNAKKRAIKVSGTYDDFKARVACAHLKKLSSKDIDSLKMSKRERLSKDLHADSGEGIITSSINSNVHTKETASILSKEFLDRDRTSGSDHALSLLSSAAFSKKPKNFLELNRDFRRLKDLETKRQYIDFVGQRRCIKLMGADSDAEFLEDIITVLLSGVCAGARGIRGEEGRSDVVVVDSGAVSAGVASSSKAGGGNSSSNNDNDNDNNSVKSHSNISPKQESVDSVFEVPDPNNTEAAAAAETSNDADNNAFSQIDDMDILQWILAFTKLPKFSMLKCFFSETSKNSLAAFFDTFETNVAVGDVADGDHSSSNSSSSSVGVGAGEVDGVESKDAAADNDASNLRALCSELRDLYL